MAFGSISGRPAGGRVGIPPRAWPAAELLPHEPRLSPPGKGHRVPYRGPLSPTPRVAPVARQQRVWPLLLLSPLRRAISCLAARALRQPERGQSPLGRLVLEPHLYRLGADRAADHARRAERPGTPAGLSPLHVGDEPRMLPERDTSVARANAQHTNHHELHEHVQTARLLRLGAVPGHRVLGLLPTAQ